MFASILIPDKNTRELKIIANSMGKKLNFSCFMDLYVLIKSLEKWKKNNPL